MLTPVQAQGFRYASALKDTIAEGLLDDTQKELRESVHAFAEKEIAPRAAGIPWGGSHVI